MCTQLQCCFISSGIYWYKRDMQEYNYMGVLTELYKAS